MLDAAVALAGAMGGKVRLVHVVVPPTPFAPAPGMVPATGVDPVPGLVARAREWLEQLEGEQPTGRFERGVVEVGPVAERLMRVAAEEKADIVVIGAHQHGAIARLLGTTAAHVVNRARTPVFVVRPRADGRGSGAMLRILAAVDSSDTAEAVVARAASLACAPGARIRLLRVEPHLDQGRTVQVRNIEDSTSELRRLETRIPLHLRDGIEVVRGEPEKVICERAHDYRADVVVMGAHAYRWTERILGTTASRVVDHIDRPLLVVREASRGGLSFELRSEHERLDRTYRSLLDAFQAGDWTTVQAEWVTFETALRAHMAREEHDFFPRFRSVYRSETAALELQHRELGERLDAFAIAIELHTVALSDAEALIETLRRHASREERVFYPWLDVAIPTSRASETVSF